MVKGLVKEYRVVCGQSRTCKIVDGKVSEVFDEKKGQYVTLDEFERDHGGNTDQVVVNGVSEEKREYFTTHGKKQILGKTVKIPDNIGKRQSELPAKNKVVDTMISTKKTIDTKSKAAGVGTTAGKTAGPVTAADVKLPVDGATEEVIPEEPEVEVKEEAKKEKFLEKSYNNIVEEAIDLLYMQED